LAFNNPSVPWSEVERIASGRAPFPGDGSDSPAWSRKREGYAGAPDDLRDRRGRDDGGERWRAPYAELHVHSNFSFLDGASHPEALVEEAARLELDALVLTDHDGMYGAVRFNDAARELGVRVGFGAELSLDLPAPQAGEPRSRRVAPAGARPAAGGLPPALPRHLPRPDRRRRERPPLLRPRRGGR
jgi:error-prone DNA polymerase